MPALDLLSTSQTSKPCLYGAPLVACISKYRAVIMQSCCNHWDCPHCGEVRARQEYHRITWGAEVLADDHPLYFWTLTCRGKECSLEEAEANYYAWTNVLLSNARARAKRKGHYWAYVQVTERQHKTRAHPHSHIITTFLPDDAVPTLGDAGNRGYVSRWFSQANASAMLGTQHRISAVENAAAVSRYIAKYLFKDSMADRWPPKWKRVRYSQNWPRPPAWTFDWTQPLLKPADWQAAAEKPVIFVAETAEMQDMALHHLANVTYQRQGIRF